jgi:hypothetical protein
MAAWQSNCSCSVTRLAALQRHCFIAADELLTNKKHAEMLQSYEVREDAALAFLQAVNPAVSFASGALRDPKVFILASAWSTRVAGPPLGCGTVLYCCTAMVDIDTVL